MDCDPDEEKLFYPVTALLLDKPEDLGEIEYFGSNFACIVIEDFDEAAKCEGEEIQGLSFDEYCSWISQNSAEYLLTIGGYV